MRELIIDGLKRVLAHPDGSAETAFVLNEEEAAVAMPGPNGIPLLKRAAALHKGAVKNSLVNRLRDELSI